MGTHIYLGLKCHSSSPELNPIGTYCLFVYGEGEISVEKKYVDLPSVPSNNKMKRKDDVIHCCKFCHYDGGDCCQY